MPAKLIDGHVVSQALLGNVKKKVALLKKQGVAPKLAVVLAGNSPASELYVEKKKKACEELGIAFELVRFGENVSEQELVEAVQALDERDDVHAILVQLPLPKGIDRFAVLDEISPEKDADGFSSVNLGLLDHGNESIVSCTALGILRLVESTGAKIEGSNVCIVNDTIVVGRPLAKLFLNRNATVEICNFYTKDLGAHTRNADILVTAVGKPGLITADMVKPGAVVIDAGIAKSGEKTVGDVDFEAVKKVASFITPVPGGVGPMTIACLAGNVAELAMMQLKA
ncbi:MAG: tetrahydrofolate dehydrogenase/cyclohydrolase catalytic domain-containing protein [archaeon]